MRINYKTILFDLRLSALVSPTREKIYIFSDEDIKSRGSEFVDPYPRYNVKNDDYVSRDINAHHAISVEATNKGMFGSDKYSSGSRKYENPILDLAIEFAVSMGDRPLIRALKRLGKYDKQIYENLFIAYENAYIMDRANKGRADRLEGARESLEVLQKANRDLPSKESKKKIIAKRKEISKIISSGKRADKTYAKKYVKHLKKAAPARAKLLYEGKYQLARDIFYYISRSGVVTPEKYDVKYDGKKEYLFQTKYKIDNLGKEKLFQELQEKYYSNNQSKSL